MHDGKDYIRILVIALIVMIILTGLYFYFVPMVYGQEAIPSPTRKPIKTPTSAPTEPADESMLYLPIILNAEPTWRPTSAPTETPAFIIQQPNCLMEPCPAILMTATPMPPQDDCDDIKWMEDPMWYYCCKNYGVACGP